MQHRTFVLKSGTGFEQDEVEFIMDNIKPMLTLSWNRKHRTRQNRTPPRKSIVFIVVILPLSFFSVFFKVNCVFFPYQGQDIANQIWSCLLINFRYPYRKPDLLEKKLENSH